MMERTHLAAGVASALLVFQPVTRVGLTCAITGGALGGVFADVDVKADSSKYAEMTAAGLTLALLGVDYLTDGGVFDRIYSNGTQTVIGLVLMLFLFLLGKTGEHRGRTHSFIYMGLTSLAFTLIDGEMAAAFAVGYLSHLAADLVNMKPEKLLFPSQKGYCLNLCHSDSLANELCFTLSVSLSAGYMLMVMA